MTLTQLQARDKKAAAVVLAYQNNEATRGATIDALRRCGWSMQGILKMLEAIDNNIVRVK